LKKWLALLALAICLVFTTASADDVLKIRIDSVAYVETEKSYLCLQCELAEENDVMLSVTDADGRLVYQRNYGPCIGLFTSENIYLRMEDSASDYSIHLSSGATAYDLIVRKKVQRLKDNTACSVGLPLSQLNGRSSWQSVTLLDWNTLSSGPVTTPLHASGNVTLGNVTFSLSGNQLCVNASTDPLADCEITSSSVYVASTRSEVESLGTQNFHGIHTGLGSGIAWPDSSVIAVLVQLTVSYNPGNLPGSPQTTLSGQGALYQSLQSTW